MVFFGIREEGEERDEGRKGKVFVIPFLPFSLLRT